MIAPHAVVHLSAGLISYDSAATNELEQKPFRKSMASRHVGGPSPRGTSGAHRSVHHREPKPSIHDWAAAAISSSIVEAACNRGVVRYSTVQSIPKRPGSESREGSGVG